MNLLIAPFVVLAGVRILLWALPERVPARREPRNTTSHVRRLDA